MDHKITHVSDVEKELSVTFSAEEVSSQVADAYRRIGRSARLNGFRPGKAPLSVLKQFYGKGVVEDTEMHFVETGIHEAIEKEGLRLIQRPLITQKGTVAEGSEFSFTFRVETFPTIDAAVRELQIEYSPVRFKEEMLEEELTSFRDTHTVFSEVDREAGDGDRVTVTFNGTRDGEPVPGVQGAEVPVTIGQKQFIEGFEQAIAGHRAGDKFVTPITFPETYHAAEIAGKSVDFAFEVLKVEEGAVPELTDELVATHHDKAKTVAELRDLIRERIESYLENINRESRRHLLVERYVEESDFAVPPSFLESETESRLADRRRRAPGAEPTPEDVEQVKKEALFAAKRFLLLSRLGEELKVAVDDRALDAELAVEAARYGVAVEQLKRYLGEERLEERRFALRERMVIDHLMEKTAFTEKSAEQ